MKRKKILKIITMLLIMVTMSVSIVSAEEIKANPTVSDKLPFSEVVSLIKDDKIVKSSILDDNIILELSDGTIEITKNTDETKDYLKQNDLKPEKIKTDNGFSFLDFLLVLLTIIGLMCGIIILVALIIGMINRRRFNKMLKEDLLHFNDFLNDQIRMMDEQQMSDEDLPPHPFQQRMPPFQDTPFPRQNQAKKEEEKKEDDKPKVTLKDVEGLDELKEDIYRIIDYLKNPEKYKEIGARAPKGVILYGPPGTGKTLIAKAIAGEAGVSFLNAVGSDFCEKYVGVGPKRVRDLYKKARAKAPCIVFIDEVDAVAGKRDVDGNSEDERTTNALLAELDGFNTCDGVITICATNRIDMLDSAFQRAGRFDLKLAVNLPDAEGREKILKLHAKNKKMAEEINFEELSKKTIGFSGADLESLLNESALLAASKDKKEVTNEEINDAFFKIIMKGNKKKNKDVEKTKRLIAWHEAGHTLATKLLTDDSVPTVTIVGSTSGAGGVTFRTPKEKVLHSKKYLESLIKVSYAGRAAEEILLNSQEDITTGASQDIKHATDIIKDYIMSYGMGNLGMLDVYQFTRDYKNILEEAQKLAKEFYTDVLNLLKENKETLTSLANHLYEKETLHEDEIDKIMLGDVATEEV